MTEVGGRDRESDVIISLYVSRSVKTCSFGEQKKSHRLNVFDMCYNNYHTDLTNLQTSKMFPLI